MADLLQYAVPAWEVSGKLIVVGSNGLPTFATVRRALANVNASTTGEVVAAVASKKIRVLAVVALAGGTATDLTFKSASTAISPLLANDARGGEVLPYNQHGWFETVAGEALNVTTGSGAATGLLVIYVEVP